VETDWVNYNDWLTKANERQDATVTFTFDQEVFITRMDIWNQNEYGSIDNRDVKGIEVNAWNGSSWTTVGEAELDDSDA